LFPTHAEKTSSFVAMPFATFRFSLTLLTIDPNGSSGTAITPYVHFRLADESHSDKKRKLSKMVPIPVDEGSRPGTGTPRESADARRMQLPKPGGCYFPRLPALRRA
jgi:hypothetical protein